eukprot:snap_masked-scaffold_38-processed-gene-0.8-mRNA-1 protein AED:0.07 eAED:0.07 QI:0/-1/0/1/-1/1/1/0/69
MFNVLRRSGLINGIKNARKFTTEVKKTAQGAIIVEHPEFTLEWVLTSPPPLHQFEEPPIIVEWPKTEQN